MLWLVLAMLGRRVVGGCDVAADCGCEGKALRVYRLSMLDREPSIENAYEGTGLRGIVKDFEGCVSTGSERDLVNTGFGKVRPASSSWVTSSNSGRGDSSLPGMWMLSVKGRKPARPGGSSTLLKSYGAPIELMVVRLRHVEKLVRLDAREASWRPSAIHCDGREARDAGRM